MLGDGRTAEEVAQEVFLKLWTRADQYDPARGSVPAWLLTIARRSALDRIRLEGRRPPLSDFPAASGQPALAAGADGSDEARWRALRFALHDLPAEQRRAIELSFYHGLSQREIAEFLGVPLGTVKTRIRLGMDKLRRAWIGDAGRPARRSEADARGVNLEGERTQRDKPVS
jgi:RNA polymerase sigma-70 factor (ECF subfamily)